jgi:hypothetical protein
MLNTVSKKAGEERGRSRKGDVEEVGSDETGLCLYIETGAVITTHKTTKHQAVVGGTLMDRPRLEREGNPSLLGRSRLSQRE